MYYFLGLGVSTECARGLFYCALSMEVTLLLAEVTRTSFSQDIGWFLISALDFWTSVNGRDGYSANVFSLLRCKDFSELLGFLPLKSRRLLLSINATKHPNCLFFFRFSFFALLLVHGPPPFLKILQGCFELLLFSSYGRICSCSALLCFLTQEFGR